MLGARYGDDAVVAFYASVLGGTASGAPGGDDGLTPAS
jgi:hypothetical protein